MAESDPVPDCVGDVALVPGSVVLALGDTVRVRVDVSSCAMPSPVAVTWASSNSNVAVVDASGLVTAKANGSAAIIATHSPDTKWAMAVNVAPPRPSHAVSR